MYKREPRHQLSFVDVFLPFGGKLSANNCRLSLGLIRDELALTQRSTIAITRLMRSCGYLMIDWFALRGESARRR